MYRISPLILLYRRYETKIRGGGAGGGGGDEATAEAADTVDADQRVTSGRQIGNSHM